MAEKIKYHSSNCGFYLYVDSEKEGDEIIQRYFKESGRYVFSRTEDDDNFQRWLIKNNISHSRF